MKKKERKSAFICFTIDRFLISMKAIIEEQTNQYNQCAISG